VNNMSVSGINPTDLANGYYPHLRKVAVDDPEFLDIQKWLVSKGAPKGWRLDARRGTDPLRGDAILPTEMVWEGAPREADGVLRLDAALVFNFPHVALVELKKAFGFGNPNVLEMYPGLRKPVQYVTRSPIGAHWPERGTDAYRPSPDNPRAEGFAEGDVYEDATGRYKLTREWSLFARVPVWRLVA
jgi:hypothetical protein